MMREETVARVRHRQAGPLWLVAAAYSLVLGIVWYRANHYGYSYPWSDDWAIVPQLTGQEPLSLSWLLSSHNEHRIPLPRLYFLAGFHLTGGDYRWMAFGNSALLAGAAVYFNFALSEVRGRVVWSDAVVPAAVLSFAHVGSFWTFQALFVLSTVGLLIFCASLVRLAPSGGAPADRRSAWAGTFAGLSIACLSGIPGLIAALLLSLYLTCERLAPGLRAGRPGRRPRYALLALSLLTLSLCLVMLAATLRAERGLPEPAGAAGVVLTVSRMLVTPFGAQGLSWWPWTLAVPLTLLTLWISVSMRRSRWGAPNRRDGSNGVALEAARIGAVIITLLLLYVALGLGRGNSAEFPMAHYALLGIPLYLILYLWGERFVSGKVRAASRSLVVLAVTAGWLLNFGIAFEWGRANRAGGAAFRQAVLSGASAEEIAEAHIETLSHVDTPGARSAVAKGLRALQAARIDPYQCIGSAAVETPAADLPAFCAPQRGPLDSPRGDS